MEALIDSLSSRHLLLVLDNCEHLLDEVAALSAALLLVAGCDLSNVI